MSSRSFKLKLYKHQDGRCCYCDRLMVVNPDGGSKGISKRKDFATFEHLARRAEGGSDAQHNLALSCLECNSFRGLMNWVEYKSRKGRLLLPISS